MTTSTERAPDAARRSAELTGLEVEAEIGRGAFTTVFRAVREGKTYALKRPNGAAADDLGTLSAFRREAALLACVDDPAVARIFAAGHYDGAPALVLEYLPGESLADQLAVGALSQERVVEVAAQLARGLAAAHRVGLVHRDVKPGNIMMPPGQSAKLIDFGLALLGVDDAEDDRTVGTLLYTSPEQSGMLKRPVDGRSDLYSLGVVLFECLTGALPFEAVDVGELLRLHLASAVPDLRALVPGIDAALVAVVNRLLAKDPDDRYPDAATLLADLRGCPGGSVADEPAAGRWPLCGREAERDRLADRWTGALAGHGGAVVIRGAPGSGRSRLAEEVTTFVRDLPVLRAACREDEALPLAALRQAIDGHLQTVAHLPAGPRAEAERIVREAAGTAGVAHVAKLSARLEELLGDAVRVPDEGRDEHSFAAAATFLGELARRCGGLLLVLDDAHQIDAGSGRVLTQLAAELSTLPLLVVLTETGAAPSELPLTPDVVVSCGPLDAGSVHALIVSRLPGAAVTAELSRYVVARTDGSPLAVVAYLLALLDAGLLTPLWGQWHLDPAGADALPVAAGVRELLAGRLASLPEPVREHLAVAAVAGGRFRAETLIAAGASPDDVVAAVGAAVDRRVVEVRSGGWYVFVHPVLRQALLDRVGEDRQRELHAAVAVALQSLPEPLHDADHVYAVARHFRRAGDHAPVTDRRRSAHAAGLRALHDRAPTEAIGYLEDAADGVAAPGTAVLHPLAIAYLRDHRFDEAARTLQRAVAAERDRRARARLLTTEIELHYTLGDDGKAMQAAGRALAELGRPLPRNPLLAVSSTLSVALLGGLVRRSGIGRGTAVGTRRDDLEALAAVLDAGGYAAVVGLRPVETAVFGLRALYAVNRVGPSPEYARIYALAGYTAMLLKLRGVGERCFARALATATGLNDPGLIAYVQWFRGCALMFGGHEDGAVWGRVIAKEERWFGSAQLLPSYSSIGLRMLLRGYTRQTRAEYERGLRRVPDQESVRGTPFSLLGVMLPALEGRPAEAAAELELIRAKLAGGSATKSQWANFLVGALYTTIEQGEFGRPFEEFVEQFHELGLKPYGMMPQHRWFFVFQLYGRLAQLRMAADDEREQKIVAARQALHQVRKIRNSPTLEAAYRIGTAALALLLGDPKRSLAQLVKAEGYAHVADAPILHFEVARFRARVYRAQGLPNESERQARNALLLASHHGWEPRRRQIRTEFGVEEGAATNRTIVDRRGETGRNRHLEALQQVGTAAATVLDPVQLARVALDEMLRILGAERALFFLLDDAGEPVQFAGRSAEGEDLTETTAYGTTLVRRVAGSGEALVLTGTEQGAALGSRSAVVHGLRSILVAPVQFKGTAVGVVYLDSRMARGIFTDDDVEVLTAVTSHVAVSLETARAAQLHLAVKAAQQQQAFAEMLRASLAELSDVHDPARLLRHLFGTLAGQLDATAGVLLAADGSVVGSLADSAVGSVVEVTGTTDPAVRGRAMPMPNLPESAPALLIGSDSAGSDSAGSGWAGSDWAGFLDGVEAVLAVPLDHRDGRAGMALLGGAAFDETAHQVAAALATQGMSAYDNARLFSRVQELATTDELTGRHNRRHFYAIAGALVDTAQRNHRDLAGAMIDIDKFKGINDTYGHGVGDEVIRTVAARISASVRYSDVLGRYGGEEFAVVLPDHDGAAPELAERMRQAVADTPIETQAGPIPVTISVGLTQMALADTTLDQLLARADHALYRAKESGRNRVVVS